MGGGGGQSGTVDWPGYMKDFHSEMLEGGGVFGAGISVADGIKTAWNNSPWLTAAAYDPDVDIAAWEANMAAFSTALLGIDAASDWAALFAQAKLSIDGATEDEIAADAAAFSDILDDEYLTKILPRFEGGMRNINAVVSSAFVIGESIIEGFRNRDLAKYISGIKIAKTDAYIAGTEQMLKVLLSKYGWQEAFTKTTIESRKIKIIAKKEQVDLDLEYDKGNALWNLELFKYGGNALASIGSASQQKEGGPTKAQTALGSAMAGAAAGAYIGSFSANPYGVAIGAAIGGTVGFASAYV